MARPVSLTGLLARAGFREASRDAEMFAEPFLAAVRARLDDAGLERLVGALGRAADPDRALLGLVRLGEAVENDAHRLQNVLAEDSASRDRLIGVLGASPALGDWLISHPDDVSIVLDVPDGIGSDPRRVRALMLRSVGADPSAPVPVAAAPAGDGTLDEMRRTYRRFLLEIATQDLTSSDPEALLPDVAAALAHLAGGALEAALALARAEFADHAAGVRLAVLGMGKTGGEELNYISDVDVIYVAEPAEGVAEDEAMRSGARLAAAMARMCSMPSREPALWEVDAALRPEGKNGPLVRTLESHLSYYERWAKTWEFQALLKARHVAGDTQLSSAYLEATRPLVWDAVGRENFVEDAQAMRRRVEDHVPIAEADRQIKLGRGGLRDVEFTVQLLQLVHGRVDPTIRSANTLDALAALAAGGYVGRDHAVELAQCYRFLRVLEHRVQLSRLRRTHLMPTGEEELRRLARAARLPVEGPGGLSARWRTTRRQVRRLHEDLYYRPLLPETARLSADDASLTAEAATARLRAIGYRDPSGATRHIKALTEGVSRRAAIQRQLLPVMLGWFAEGSDPDGALLAFRKLSDSLGSTHWYLKLLRDSGAAADRLAHLLSASTYVADNLAQLTDAVAWLDDDKDLQPRTTDALATHMDAMLVRRDDATKAASAVRFLRRRELTRGAIRDVLEHVPVDTCRRVISPAADMALAGALRIAAHEANVKHELTESPTAFLVVAMGRLGGAEVVYASDADVMFVHDPRPGADGQLASAWALEVANSIASLLGSMASEPQLAVDTALRPEGKQGPVVRTLDSYAKYYQRWALGWERQALLRARVACGDGELGERFTALIQEYRYPAGGLDSAELRELRRIKARVEAERLPRGVPATHHLKLGRGGLTDVEWTAQLLQLQHAGEHPELRVPGTREALLAARDLSLLSGSDADQLIRAWELATRLRNAIVLATGRARGQRVDILPAERQTLSTVSRLLGYEPGHAVDLEQDWLRAARRARTVMERVFYG
ncbi:bifunctional [glutamine synthetase] adenylyltransferase/[glutamine synthetase]-adenylyl-L-tyrosine phosphorylase [Ruania halotolerans]|uniref:bifunctional [glutamine synthetase] adenylyltransferase/[glutamine synthetase]-adenylyl-L-tyrosine phosphorylase n=1 Tax=Ruania halotolerans TaxID=2897773 RepID=UPI001E4A1474|nr:bifunctional [glutamine synthetase] adenylyltransferase/[glutamine synthetase]-adenylyl-L-tyrosine phosphorylase [Ruania halotolerans]UFU04860.1 bifunctional [glutamine synthetase] adenylyltransferase/[glutamine synthetase]-adenylyl-L-tyrosine phosphorylase [Ruania halotolerans]